jgi:hypothetical protein
LQLYRQEPSLTFDRVEHQLDYGASSWLSHQVSRRAGRAAEVAGRLRTFLSFRQERSSRLFACDPNGRSKGAPLRWRERGAQLGYRTYISIADISTFRYKFYTRQHKFTFNAARNLGRPEQLSNLERHNLDRSCQGGSGLPGLVAQARDGTCLGRASNHYGLLSPEARRTRRRRQG